MVFQSMIASSRISTLARRDRLALVGTGFRPKLLPWWHHRCCRASTSTPKHSWTVTRVQRGTEAWIQTVVVDMGMCPFAAKSNYRIHVYTNDDDQSAGMEAFIVAHAHKLASRKDNDHHHPTTILVFPELDMDDALAQRVLLSEAVALSNGLMGSHMVDVHSQIERLEEVAMATLQEKMELAEKNGEEFSQAEFDKILNELISNVQPPAEDNASPILSVPFSTMTDNAADSNKLVMIQGQAPWFTIQLFLREDMNKARGVGNKMQQQIIARNEDMDARIDNESKNQLFQSFRNM